MKFVQADTKVYAE